MKTFPPKYKKKVFKPIEKKYNPPININYDIINKLFSIINNGDILQIKDYMLSNNINLNVLNENNESILHIIIKNSQLNEYEKLQLVNYAVDRLAPLDVSDKIFGKTPLHYAAELQLGEIIDLLLKNYADINRRDILGKTPLHYLVLGSQVECSDSSVNYNLKNIKKDDIELNKKIEKVIKEDELLSKYFVHVKKSIYNSDEIFKDEFKKFLNEKRIKDDMDSKELNDIAEKYFNNITDFLNRKLSKSELQDINEESLILIKNELIEYKDEIKNIKINNIIKLNENFDKLKIEIKEIGSNLNKIIWLSYSYSVNAKDILSNIKKILKINLDKNQNNIDFDNNKKNKFELLNRFLSDELPDNIIPNNKKITNNRIVDEYKKYKNDTLLEMKSVLGNIVNKIEKFSSSNIILPSLKNLITKFTNVLNNNNFGNDIISNSNVVLKYFENLIDSCEQIDCSQHDKDIILIINNSDLVEKLYDVINDFKIFLNNKNLFLNKKQIIGTKMEIQKGFFSYYTTYSKIHFYVEKIDSYINKLKNNKLHITEQYFLLTNIILNYRNLYQDIINFINEIKNISNFVTYYKPSKIVNINEYTVYLDEIKFISEKIYESGNKIIRKSNNIYDDVISIINNLNDNIEYINNRSEYNYIKLYNDTVNGNDINDVYLYPLQFFPIIEPSLEKILSIDYINDDNYKKIQEKIINMGQKIDEENFIYYVNKNLPAEKARIGWLVPKKVDVSGFDINKNNPYPDILDNVDNTLKGKIGVINNYRIDVDGKPINNLKKYLSVHFGLIKNNLFGLIKNNLDNMEIKRKLKIESEEVYDKLLKSHIDDIFDTYIKNNINLFANMLVLKNIKQLALPPASFDVEFFNDDNSNINLYHYEKPQDEFRMVTASLENKITYDRCFKINKKIISKFINNNKILIDTKDNYGKSAIYYVIDAGNIELIELLFNKYVRNKNINSSEPFNYTLSLYDIHLDMINKNNNLIYNLIANANDVVLGELKKNSKIKNNYIENSDYIFPVLVLKINELFNEELENGLFDLDNIGLYTYDHILNFKKLISNNKLKYESGKKNIDDDINNYINNNREKLVHLNGSIFDKTLINNYKVNNNIHEFNSKLKIINKVFKYGFGYVINMFEKSTINNKILLKSRNNIILILKKTLFTHFYETIETLLKESHNKKTLVNVKNYIIDVLPQKVVKIMSGIFDNENDDDKKITIDEAYNNINNILSLVTPENKNLNETEIKNIKQDIIPFYKEYIRTYIENMDSFQNSYIKYIKKEINYMNMLNIMMHNM